MNILERNNLVLDEEMQLSNDRVAVGVTDESGRKYYVIYLGTGAQTTSKEHAKVMLMDALEKRHDLFQKSKPEKKEKPKTDLVEDFKPEKAKKKS